MRLLLLKRLDTHHINKKERVNPNGTKLRQFFRLKTNGLAQAQPKAKQQTGLKLDKYYEA